MSLINNTSKVFRSFWVNQHSKRLISLHHSLLFKKELSVPTFCNVTVDVPFSINIRPLDVHKYRNCDQLFVELCNFNETYVQEPLTIVSQDNNILIKDSISKDNNLEELYCTIVAPIKANLNVRSKFGNILIENFNGEEILISSETGNVSVDGFQGNKIDVKLDRGNVNFRGVLQSSSVEVEIFEKGSVFINKLLGEKAKIKTKCGNIYVNSSYCNASKFLIEKGDMDLRNIHKHCEIINTKFGNIKIVGLDGLLKLTQESGNADINLSRITEDSYISLTDGHLLLRLSEECQEIIKFKIDSRSVNFNENVKVNHIDSNCSNEHKVVRLNCQKGTINIEAASWFDMNIPEKFESN